MNSENEEIASKTLEMAMCLQRVFDKCTYPTSCLFYYQRKEGSPGSKSLLSYNPLFPI